MNGINIQFGFDELPADGEICHVCKLPITGNKFVPFIQVGDPKEAEHLPQVFCERCYKEEKE